VTGLDDSRARGDDKLLECSLYESRR